MNWKPGRPLALDVSEGATLNDFFARIIVHENGRISLQDVSQRGATRPRVAAAARRSPRDSRRHCQSPVRREQQRSKPPSGAAVIRFGPWR